MARPIPVDWKTKPAGEACKTCPLKSAPIIRSEPATAVGASGRVSLAVVGEAPGYQECHELRPFVGGAGKLLQKGLRRVLKLKREDVHWTNAILCDARQLVKKEYGAAAKACSARLRSELAEVNPEVVMPLGAYSLKSAVGLTKKPDILRWRGSISRVSWPEQTLNPGLIVATSGATLNTAAEGNPPLNATGRVATAEVVEAAAVELAILAPLPPASRVSLVMPTIHPGFAKAQPQWLPVLEIDFERVRRIREEIGLTKWKPPEEDPSRTLLVARTLESLKAGLQKLGPFVSFDVETLGLGPTETPLVCFGLSDGVLTIVVPWSRTASGQEPYWSMPQSVARAVSEALKSRTVVTHNGPAFDHIVANRYGIEIPVSWDDTLLMQHAIRGHLKKHLAFVATTAGGEGIDVPPWKELEDRGVNVERLYVYNGRDCLYTILAYHLLKRDLREAQ